MAIDTVCVVGLGYIGLPTAAILASQELKVLGVDVDPRVVDAVNRGDVPFVEPDLATYVAGAVGHGALRASTTPEPSDAFVVAVPTPLVGDHAPDVSFVESAARALAPSLRGGELVILESTSPPGTTRRMAGWILEERPDLSVDGTPEGLDLHLAHCPERVLPGRVMIELVTNDRVVGGLTPEAARRAQELYSRFCHGQILLTDATTAELVKLAENSFRDVNIAFANELAAVADRVGVDVWELIGLANHHPRVDILRPGPGVGGHCVAVDPWFVVDAAPDDARLIRTARHVNDARPHHVVDQVRRMVEGVERPRIAALGLAFKADVDDLRESPAVQVVHHLATARPDATVAVAEPYTSVLPPALARLGNVELTSAADALRDADAQVLLVGHDAFRGALDDHGDPERLIDTCGVARRSAGGPGRAEVRRA